MSCTLSCAVCEPGAACARCGWQEKERAIREYRVKRGDLAERIIIRNGRPTKVKFLQLKAREQQ